VLVEQDMRGLTAEEQDPDELRRAERWIKRRVCPHLDSYLYLAILSVPAGVLLELPFGLDRYCLGLCAPSSSLRPFD
jgi:hypothetical protein